MDRYANRQEAGQVLSDALKTYANKKNVVVLALPRGGVPVAYEIAKALHAPLDVFIVRKLGVPGHEELAMGAIATNGVTVLNEEIVRDLGITAEAIHQVTQKEMAELKRRELAYRGKRPFPALAKKIIILVDDGIATGATMRAAVKALRQFQPAQIVIAVPVAEKNTALDMNDIADQVICPLKPVYFSAVGAWYDQFDQTSDEEVQALLK